MYKIIKIKIPTSSTIDLMVAIREKIKKNKEYVKVLIEEVL